MTADPLHIAYTSRLAAEHDYTVFGEICRRARERNVQHGIAGVLLFDGLRFFQWLYGEAGAVSRLMGRIAADARHTDLVLRLHQPLAALQGPAQWRSGFVEPDALDDLGPPPGDAGRIVEAIGRLLARADLDEPVLIRS